MSYSILIVDDNKGILSALKLSLSHHFDNVVTLDSPKTLMSTMNENSFDVVLLDMNFKTDINTGNEGLYWLGQIKKNFAVEVVLFTAFGDVELAVTGIKQGAYDFLLKPWDNEKLLKTLLDAAKHSKSLRKNKKSGHANVVAAADETPLFWGSSPKMTALRGMVEKMAHSMANILITGENGTGKDVLAQEIYRLSDIDSNGNRLNKPFVPVDMGSMPETLFESELFGHVKGAFTDAYQDHVGKFELANGGTIFLDEIGNIPLHLQSKLLRVLQNRVMTRVGDNKLIPINIRLICATNANLETMVREGKFREDLYYRVNTIKLQLPSLRERKEDIVPLAEMFVGRFSEQYEKDIIAISPEAQAVLTECQWGGNVRELQNCVEKAVILCDDDILRPSDFQLNYLNFWKPQDENSCNATLDDIEREAISSVIKMYNGNLSLVAKHLDISRQTLYNKIKKYDL